MISIPLGMIAYTGIETISNMAEEAKDETTSIPAAISRVRIAVFAIYFTLPAIALSALPVEQVNGEYQTKLGLPEDEGGFAGDPILGVVKQIDLGPLQSAGELYVGILAATILFIATNAAIIGVSRLVYSMGIHRQLPDGLRRLHPRYRTPWIGILIFSGVAILTILPGQADFLGLMYAFGAMLSFTIAHLSVIRLRISQPDLPRPYRGPWNVRVRGADFPLFAVVGGAATALAFLATVVLNPDVAAAGTAWLALGLILYWIYRRGQGLDLTSTHKVAIAQPVVDHEAEYDSVLLHVGDNLFDEQTLATAVKLASRKTPRDPRAGHDHRAQRADYRRSDARGRGRCRFHHRAGQAPRRQARLGPLGEGPRRPSRPTDHRRSPGHARIGSDHDAPVARGGRVGLRKDDRDRPRRAPLPRDHRDAPRHAQAYGGWPSRNPVSDRRCRAQVKWHGSRRSAGTPRRPRTPCRTPMLCWHSE